MNGTGTHSFMRIDTRSVISANHYVVLPIPPLVTTTVNGWASKNKIHTSREPIFTFHDNDITGDVDDDVVTMDSPSVPVPTVPFRLTPPILPMFPDETETPHTVMEPQIAQDRIEIRGKMESAGAENISNSTSDEVSGLETSTTNQYRTSNQRHYLLPCVRTCLVHQLNCMRNRREFERHQTDLT